MPVRNGVLQRSSASGTHASSACPPFIGPPIRLGYNRRTESTEREPA